MTDRDERGHFTAGNAGGPGRPRRAIETEYLRAVSDAVPLEAWTAIVERAVSDAKDGDDKARNWLAKYVIGDAPIGLTELLARELLDIDADIEALTKVDELSETGASRLLSWGETTFVERAQSVKQRVAERDAADAKRAKRASRRAVTQDAA